MIESCFNNIQKRIVECLTHAKSRVYIAVAWFTNDALFCEVLKCCQSGLDVRVIIMDDFINRNEFALDYSKLIEAGGKLFYSNNKKMHNKFCIIDNLLITGSYNWTYYAEKLNYENIILSDDLSLVNSYCSVFDNILESCNKITKYEPITLNMLSNEDMYDDYHYMCNDIALKGQDYREKIDSFNKDKNIKLKNDALEDIEFDYRGISILKKEWDPIHLIHRLTNMSIGTVPYGRPNAGRKYIHACYTSNDIFEKDEWVDIFDSEFVDEVTKYFHKRDGGSLEDHSQLPNIPESIYNPRKKYDFRLVRYTFYKFGKYGNKRKKIDVNGNIIGKPYEYDGFYTLVLSNIDKQGIEDICHVIVQSLFEPNGIDDNDMVSDKIR